MPPGISTGAGGEVFPSPHLPDAPSRWPGSRLVGGGGRTGGAIASGNGRGVMREGRKGDARLRVGREGGVGCWWAVI